MISAFDTVSVPFVVVQYPDMEKTMGEFTLEIKGGEFTDSEIMVMLGENGKLCEHERASVY